MEKEGNNKQMLVFMNRMDLMRGSSGNHNLRHDSQKDRLKLHYVDLRKNDCRNLSFLLFFIKSE